MAGRSAGGLSEKRKWTKATGNSTDSGNFSKGNDKWVYSIPPFKKEIESSPCDRQQTSGFDMRLKVFKALEKKPEGKSADPSNAIRELLGGG